MYLRETRRKNRDGSSVGYLQLAHNERNQLTGNPTAKVIHNFGRAEKVDRDALARLVSSISRFLTPEQAATAAAGVEVEVIDSRRLGAAWTLDRVWERLGIGAAIRRAATGRGPPARGTDPEPLPDPVQGPGRTQPTRVDHLDLDTRRGGRGLLGGQEPRDRGHQPGQRVAVDLLGATEVVDH